MWNELKLVGENNANTAIIASARVIEGIYWKLLILFLGKPRVFERGA